MFGTGVTYAPSLSGTSGTTGASITGGDTFRGPSTVIWGSCPWHDVYEEPRFGIPFWDEFNKAGNLSSSDTTNIAMDIGDWAAFVGTNGVVAADVKLEGGVISIGAGSNSGVSITMASMAGAYRMVTTSTLALNQKLWFECRVAVDSVTSADRDCFIGLCDNTTTQVATAADTVINATTNTLNTTPNLFGFHFRSTTNPTDVGVAFNVAGGTVQYPTNLQTLINTVTGTANVARSGATGFVKLGFVFDPQGGYTKLVGSTPSTGQTQGIIRKPLIQFYVNGLLCNTFLTAAENVQTTLFPTGFMAPVIAYKSRSSNSNNFNIDWIRCFQLANS